MRSVTPDHLPLPPQYKPIEYLQRPLFYFIFFFLSILHLNITPALGTINKICVQSLSPHWKFTSIYLRMHVCIYYSNLVFTRLKLFEIFEISIVLSWIYNSYLTIYVPIQNPVCILRHNVTYSIWILFF